MHETIEGELAQPDRGAAIIRAYADLRLTLARMPDHVVDQLARAYRKGARNRTYVAAADRAADLAYDSGRVDGDTDEVVGVDDVLAQLQPLGADQGHPLCGYALDMACAVLAFDELDPADWLLITQWWRNAGAPLPIDHRPEPRRPRPARPVPPVAARAAVPQQRPVDVVPIDEVTAARLDRAERARYARRLHRRSAVLWWLQLPMFMTCAVVSGYTTSWQPLLVGVLLAVALAIFATTTKAKAGRQ